MDQPAFSPPRPPSVDYPDSDGQTVAESDFQRIPLWYANDALARYFRDRHDVYVSANMFVYFEEGNPKAVVAPDVFVVLGAPNHTIHCKRATLHSPGVRRAITTADCFGQRQRVHRPVPCRDSPYGGPCCSAGKCEFATTPHYKYLNR